MLWKRKLAESSWNCVLRYQILNYQSTIPEGILWSESGIGRQMATDGLTGRRTDVKAARPMSGEKSFRAMSSFLPHGMRLFLIPLLACLERGQGDGNAAVASNEMVCAVVVY